MGVNAVKSGSWSKHRGAVTGADPALSASFPHRGAILNTKGWQSVLFWVELDGFTDITINIVAYDEDSDSFHRLAQFASVSNSHVQSVSTYGQRIYMGISAVNGAASGDGAAIHVAGGTQARAPVA